jgi:hypothetical protein
MLAWNNTSHLARTPRICSQLLSSLGDQRCIRGEDGVWFRCCTDIQLVLYHLPLRSIAIANHLPFTCLVLFLYGTDRHYYHTGYDTILYVLYVMRISWFIVNAGSSNIPTCTICFGNCNDFDSRHWQCSRLSSPYHRVYLGSPITPSGIVGSSQVDFGWDFWTPSNASLWEIKSMPS